MAERISFECWYADETVHTGTTLEDWRAMPEEGVLVIVERMNASYGHPRKCAGTRHAYVDYFWMNEAGEIGAGAAKQIPENVHIKRGQYVDDATWERIYNAACVDPIVE